MKDKNIKVKGGLRTTEESQESFKMQKVFEESCTDWGIKMENFPKFIKRQNLTRLLSLYEIFKLVVEVKGSIIECGVNQGFGLMSWAKFSSIIEPVNLTRRIYGFDTFEGFPDIDIKDKSQNSNHVKKGDLKAEVFEELQNLIEIYDSTRFLGHINKIELIKGNAIQTIPEFIKKNPHLLVSLLFLDFDLYEPTKVAIENFIPRMPKGSIIAFDELDNPLWPGETLAMLESHSKYNFEIRRFPFDPYIGYAILH